MNKYLSGKAALVFWKARVDRDVTERYKEKLNRDYVVFGEDSLYRPAREKPRSRSVKGTVKSVENNERKLPWIFLQLASEYNVHKLIVLGFLLCSWQNNTKALCSLKELEDCALELRGCRGRRKALRAIRYLKESSRSPSESMVCMFLRLPGMKGEGGQFERVFNHKIEGVMPNGERFTYYAAIHNPSRKLVLDYERFRLCPGERAAGDRGSLFLGSESAGT